MSESEAASKRLERYHRQYREELFDYVLPFWERYGFDREYGGIITSVDERGRRYSTDKSVWMQGRAAWTFSRLYNTYGGNAAWLERAKSCLDFLDAHCVDPRDGKLYFSVTRDGRPLRRRRYLFSEAFYVLGHAEYFRATGAAESLAKARDCYDRLYAALIEGRDGLYAVEPKYDPETRPTRAFASYMILLDVASTLKRSDPERVALYDRCIRRCAEEILDVFLREDLDAVLETVATDGSYLGGTPMGRVMNPGHGLEGVWFLINELDSVNHPGMLDRVERMYEICLRRGWDARFGGVTYMIDVEGRPPEAYEHDMKHWWGACEALNAAAALFEKTGKAAYFDDFERLTEHTFRYFSDHRYGEWVGYLRRDCRPTEPPVKGHLYKGPYHVPRMLMNVEQLLAKRLQRR